MDTIGKRKRNNSVCLICWCR